MPDTPDNEGKAAGYFDEFLDDYFAECDEHLTALRRNLLVLESFVSTPPVDRGLIEELFRACHTLKGLSGMVGLVDAESLAHRMEEYLRRLRCAETTVTSDAVDALFDGTRALESVIAARRNNGRAPDIAIALAALEAIAPDAVAEIDVQTDDPAAPAAPLPGLDERIAAAERAGRAVYRFTFSPDAGTAMRGVHVDDVRNRLLANGEMLDVQPRVAGTEVEFEFVISYPPNFAPDEAWKADGLSWSRWPAAHRRLPMHSAVTAPPLANSRVVRVDLARLDELMVLVGELVLSRARIQDHLGQLDATSSEMPVVRALAETNVAMERQLRELREGVMRVRLVPIGEAFERMRFVVREAAREDEKEVELELHGQETAIDKLVVERIMEPLLHLVRNAVSHGLERPAERTAAGKPARGRVQLRACTEGDSVVVEIVDDGRGVDLRAVASRAAAQHLVDNEAVLDDHDDALLAVLCEPGFSTRENADMTSGRGVGMAVVKQTIAELGGTLSLRNQPGRGACFRIQLPLTLMIVDALLVRVGDQTLAIPQPALREVMEIAPGDITPFENNEVIPYRGNVLPLVRLGKVFGIESAARASLAVLVVGTDGNSAGLVADRILGQREIVVRALSDPLVTVQGIAGATELSDGRVVLILDAASLAAFSSRRAPQADRPAFSPATAPPAIA